MTEASTPAEHLLTTDVKPVDPTGIDSQWRDSKYAMEQASQRLTAMGRPDVISSLSSQDREPQLSALEGLALGADDLNARAALLETAVCHHAATGNYWGATRLLNDSQANRASLPAYQNEFFAGRCYDLALEQGFFNQAERVAAIMADPENYVAKYQYQPDTPNPLNDAVAKLAFHGGWEQREQRAFEAQVKEALGSDNPGDVIYMHGRYLHREDGAANPSVLFTELARRACDIYADLPQLSDRIRAVQTAFESNLPHADVQKYMGMIPPTARVIQRIQRVVTSHLESLREKEGAPENQPAGAE